MFWCWTRTQLEEVHSRCSHIGQYCPLHWCHSRRPRTWGWSIGEFRQNVWTLTSLSVDPVHMHHDQPGPWAKNRFKPGLQGWAHGMGMNVKILSFGRNRRLLTHDGSRSRSREWGGGGQEVRWPVWFQECLSNLLPADWKWVLESPNSSIHVTA